MTKIESVSQFESDASHDEESVNSKQKEQTDISDLISTNSEIKKWHIKGKDVK